LETAFAGGPGRATILSEIPTASSGNQVTPATLVVDDRYWQRRDFSTRLECTRCNRQFADPEPRRLSFNSPLAACAVCEGTGEAVGVGIKNAAKQASPGSACQGTRLNADALGWRVGGLNLAELTRLTIDATQKLFDELPSAAHEERIARPLLAQ